MSFIYLSFLANALSDVAEIDIKVVLSNITATAQLLNCVCLLFRYAYYYYSDLYYTLSEIGEIETSIKSYISSAKIKDSEHRYD